MRINQKFHTIVHLIFLLFLSFLHLTCSDCALENPDELLEEVQKDVSNIVNRYNACETDTDCILVYDNTYNVCETGDSCTFEDSTYRKDIHISCKRFCRTKWSINRGLVDEFANEMKRLNKEKCAPHEGCHEELATCPLINYLPGDPACLREFNECGTRDDDGVEFQ